MTGDAAERQILKPTINQVLNSQTGGRLFISGGERVVKFGRKIAGFILVWKKQDAQLVYFPVAKEPCFAAFFPGFPEYFQTVEPA